jgi:hypothetical protein
LSFWIKLAFIFIEIALAIAFAVLGGQKKYNQAGVLEWVISLIYIFYVWSYIIDFLPAVKTRAYEDRYPDPHPKIRAQDDEMAMNTQANGNMMGGPVYTNGGGQENAQDTYLNYQPPQQNQAPSRNF